MPHDLLLEIRQELMPGRFVRYDDMFIFGRHLHEVEEKIAALVESGEAERAIGLYVVKVLDAPGYKLFVQHCERLVDDGLAGIPDPEPTAIFGYENNVRLPALSLKRQAHAGNNGSMPGPMWGPLSNRG